MQKSQKSVGLEKLENLDPRSVLDLFDEARKDFFRRGPLSPFSPFAARVGFVFVDHPMVAAISREGDIYVGWGFLELAREFLARGVSLEEWVRFLLAHELSHPYLDFWSRAELLREILQAQGEVIPDDRLKTIANDAQDIVINNFLTQLLSFPRYPDLSLLPESFNPPLPPENSFEENFFALLELMKKAEGPSSQGDDRQDEQTGEGGGEASTGAKTSRATVPPTDSPSQGNEEVSTSGTSASSPSPDSLSKQSDKGEGEDEGASEGAERGEEEREGGSEAESEGQLEQNGGGDRKEGETFPSEDSMPSLPSQKASRTLPRPLGTPLTPEEVRELRERTLARKGEGQFGEGGALIPALRQVALRKAQRIAGQEPGSPWGKVTPTPTTSLPWQALLRRHLLRAKGAARQVSGRGKRTYPHPHQGIRNQLFRERGLTPPLKARRVLRLPKVAVILDTSGSMVEDYSKALGEVVRIAREMGEIRLLLAHTKVYADLRVKPWGREERAGMEFESGGTDLRSAFALLEKDPPDVAVVVTDGETPWPPSPPSYPVVVALVYSPTTPPPSWARVVFVDK
jgi:predicted metal-dependent peptidase